MTINEKATEYNKYFETKTRDNGKSFVCLTEDAPEELRDSIRGAHGDKLPDDWVYGTYADLMQRVTDYDINTTDDLEDNRSEIVDGMVDTYTADLTEWLHHDNGNVSYLTDVLTEMEPRDGFQLLAMAQYKAIDEIMSYVVDLLEN